VCRCRVVRALSFVPLSLCVLFRVCRCRCYVLFRACRCRCMCSFVCAVVVFTCSFVCATKTRQNKRQGKKQYKRLHVFVVFTPIHTLRHSDPLNLATTTPNLPTNIRAGSQACQQLQGKHALETHRAGHSHGERPHEVWDFESFCFWSGVFDLFLLKIRC
jgi:hypothetical protein